MPAPKLETRRVRRNWTEKFLLWRRAYETKIWQSGHEVTGRGPTPEMSEEAAKRKWTDENSVVTTSQDS
jgi:hypothetical protein